MPCYLSFSTLIFSQHRVLQCQSIIRLLLWLFHNMESYYTKVTFILYLGSKVSFVFYLGSFTTWSQGIFRFLYWFFHNIESYYAKVYLSISRSLPWFFRNLDSYFVKVSFILVLSQHGVLICQNIFHFLLWFFHNMFFLHLWIFQGYAYYSLKDPKMKKKHIVKEPK